MKKARTILLCVILHFTTAHAQVVIGSRFQPFTYDELVRPLIAQQQEYNKISNSLDALSEYIIDILSQDIDRDMRSSMNYEYNKLQSIAKNLSENGDLSSARAGYNNVLKSVRQKVVNYNNKVAKERQKAAEEAARPRPPKQQQPQDWSGSGFALNNGYICTNYHVVEGAKSIEIHGVQGDFTTSYSAKVMATDKFNDLAILKIDDSSFKGFGTIPYKVKTSMAEVGEDIFVLGYPMTTTMGDEIKLTNGIISSRTGFQGDVSLYQISAPIQPGNSGGPLFDNQGNLIGIVSAKHNGAESVGYAIKASYLGNLMESSLTDNVLPSNNSISSLPLTGKVKQINKFVYFIKCSSRENGSYKDGDISSALHIGSSSNGAADNQMKYYSTDTFSYETTAISCRIDKIESTPENLKVTFSYINLYQNGHCSIDPKTSIKYISNSGTTTKYLSKSVNIPFAPETYAFKQKGEILTFTLIFPPMPSSTNYFEISEKFDWKFYNIRLK